VAKALKKSLQKSHKKSPKKSQRKRHLIENDPFLKALGRHCAKIRHQKGFSIDRLSREGADLSASVIHRLETGSGSTTSSVLYRYAQSLAVSVCDLFQFELAQEVQTANTWVRNEEKLRPKTLKLLPWSEVLPRGAFQSLLPVYTLKAAAGQFGDGHSIQGMGWIPVKNPPRKLDRDCFVVQATGRSMEPQIQDGDWIVMRANPSGSRQGRIVLAQYSGPSDPETGGSYTVKKYSSIKEVSGSEMGEWKHSRILLEPLNPDYEPILIEPQRAEDFKILAEYWFTLQT
jgi:SOS-response transcriptional repressor LexA